MQDIKNIEELMNESIISARKNGNVNKICDVTVQMLQKKKNGVSIGMIARTTTKVLHQLKELPEEKEVDYSVVRHAVMKSKRKNEFEVFDGPDGKMVRLNTPKKQN